MSCRSARRALLTLVLASAAACGSTGPAEPDRAGPEQVPTTAAAQPTDAPTSTTAAPPPTFVPEDPDCPDVPARAEPDSDRPVYEADLRLDPGTGTVGGVVDARFVPDLDIDHLVLRLWANAPRPAAGGVRAELRDLEVDGRPVDAGTPDPTTVLVPLAQPVAAGDAVELRARIHIDVPGPTNDRISRSGDAMRLGSFLPVLPWEPGVGWSTEPPTSGFAEASSAPSADWTVHLEVPAGFDVLASGVRAGDTWRAEGARDFAVSIGRFRTARRTLDLPEPVEVVVGVHAGVDAEPEAYLDRVAYSLVRLSTMYGPYPWPTYTLAVTPDLGGGIEYPSHVMQGPGTIGRTTPHEVAHMWFYGLVGNDQGRDPWLDEGLATWAEARVEGVEADLATRSIPAAGRGRAGEPMTYWDAHPDAYYRSVYVQPAAALGGLGPPERVDCALAHYVAVNAHRTATPEDLHEALRIVFPDAAEHLAPYGL